MDGLPHALVAAVLEELPLVVLFGISSTSQLWSSLINETVAFRTTLVGPADDLAALVEAAEPGATFRVRGTCRLHRRLYITKPVRIVGENGAALIGGDGRSMITISVGGTVQVRDLELRYDAKEAPDFFVQRSIVNVIAGCSASPGASSRGKQALRPSTCVAVRGRSVLEMDRCRISGPISKARSSIGPLCSAIVRRDAVSV